MEQKGWRVVLSHPNWKQNVSYPGRGDSYTKAKAMEVCERFISRHGMVSDVDFDAKCGAVWMLDPHGNVEWYDGVVDK